MIRRRDSLVKANLRSSKQKVVECLSINDMKSMHCSDQTFCEIKIYETNSVCSISAKTGYLKWLSPNTFSRHFDGIQDIQGSNTKGRTCIQYHSS